MTVLDLPTEPAALLGMRRDVNSGFVDLYRSVWNEGIDPRVLELCRLRMAQMLEAIGPLHRRTPRTGVAEVEVAKLADWHEHDDFDDLTTTALAFTEQFLLDPNGIADDQAKMLHTLLGGVRFTAFVVALALFESYQRMCVVFDLVPKGPEHRCEQQGPHWECPTPS